MQLVSRDKATRACYMRFAVFRKQSESRSRALCDALAGSGSCLDLARVRQRWRAWGLPFAASHQVIVVRICIRIKYPRRCRRRPSRRT